MKPPRWIAASLAILLPGVVAAPVLAQFCVADPINPLCCPSPCPVLDPARLVDLLGDVDSLGQAVAAGKQIAQTTTLVNQAVGDAKAAAAAMSTQISGFAGTLSSEVTAIQTGLAVHPVQALATLEQSLFEPVGTSSSSTLTNSRSAARTAAMQTEQAAALAISLMRSKALPTLAQQQNLLTGTAGATQQLQSDMAANSASRLALYQDAGAIHQLVSAWVAQRSMRAAVAHPGGTGGTIPPPVTGSAVSSGAPASAAPTQSSAGLLDQLVSLHDARATAQTLLSAYPALQQTVAQAQLAGQFVSDAESALQQSLSKAGISSASLSDVEKALAAADGTDWLDSGKTAAGQQAATKVAILLLAGGADAAAAQQLQTAMTGWLDAAKQSRYWTSLAGQAQQSMASLDSTLGSLSDRAGVDITGAAGAAQEKRLIAQLSLDPAAAKLKPVLTAAAQDPSARSVLTYGGTP